MGVFCVERRLSPVVLCVGCREEGPSFFGRGWELFGSWACSFRQFSSVCFLLFMIVCGGSVVQFILLAFSVGLGGVYFLVVRMFCQGFVVCFL